VTNVWEAIKKYQAERKVAERSAPAGGVGLAAAGEPEAARPAGAPRARPVVVPAGAGKDYSRLLVAYHDRGGRITEGYRALRTSLLAISPKERFCYMVASADPGEGKTVTALNLALVMAEKVDRRAVAVDCDLRKSRMARLLRADPAPGMADLLRGRLRLEDVIQPTARANLSFIPAGHARHDEVAGLVGRPELETIVTELRRRYDFVLLDTPPITSASDAGMLGQAAGRALLVVRMNKTRRETVDKAIALLHAANVELAGIVLTHQKYYIPSYLYRYS